MSLEMCKNVTTSSMEFELLGMHPSIGPMYRGPHRRNVNNSQGGQGSSNRRSQALGNRYKIYEEILVLDISLAGSLLVLLI